MGEPWGAKGNSHSGRGASLNYPGRELTCAWDPENENAGRVLEPLNPGEGS